MKKVLSMLSILFIIILTFSGCNSRGDNDSRILAEQFIKNLYTVGTEQIIEYSGLLQKDVDITKMNETIQLIHKNIQPLMTEKGYENIIKNREYLLNVEKCFKNDCTLQITDILLSKELYDSKEKKAGYDYEAKVKLISTKDMKEQIDVVKGYIGLSKENSQWKVYSYKLIAIPKLFRDR